MTLAEMFVAQLESEAPRTRHALEHVPEGRDDWKPHDKSMPLGRLAMLVARMPSWFSLVVDKNELDIMPKPGPGAASNIDMKPLRTAQELVEAHDAAVAEARQALIGASEEHLAETWRLLAGGNVVNESPRSTVVRDTFMHLAHHRGQLTVYLRLTGAKVPAIYGPSADDTTFA
jgi:DinB family protein